MTKLRNKWNNEILDHIENITYEYLSNLWGTNIEFENNECIDNKELQIFIKTTNKYLLNKLSILRNKFLCKEKNNKSIKKRVLENKENISQNTNILQQKEDSENWQNLEVDKQILEQKEDKEEIKKEKEITKPKTPVQIFREKILNNKNLERYFELFYSIENFFYFRNKFYHSKITIIDFDEQMLNWKSFEYYKNKLEKLLEVDDNFQRSKNKFIELEMWNTKTHSLSIKIFALEYSINYLINNLNQDPIEVYLAYDWISKRKKWNNFKKLWNTIREYKKKLIWIDNSVFDDDKFRIIFAREWKSINIKMLKKWKENNLNNKLDNEI